MNRSAAFGTYGNDGGLAWEAIRALTRRFEPIHTGIGIFGNIAFFVGSIFFLFAGLKTVGTWLFIVGSFGMLIGGVGRAIIRVESRKLEETVRRREEERGGG